MGIITKEQIERYIAIQRPPKSNIQVPVFMVSREMEWYLAVHGISTYLGRDKKVAMLQTMLLN